MFRKVLQRAPLIVIRNAANKELIRNAAANPLIKVFFSLRFSAHLRKVINQGQVSISHKKIKDKSFYNNKALSDNKKCTQYE